MKREFIAMFGTLVGGIIGAVIVGRVSAKVIKEKQIYANKHLAMFMTMNQWIKIKQEGKSFTEYLKKKNIKTIAIYGMSYMGQSLLAELKDSDIKVLYGIDKMADSIYSDIDVYTPEIQFPKVDGVIVTSVYYFDEIEKILNAKMDCPILSLEDIVYDM